MLATEQNEGLTGGRPGVQKIPKITYFQKLCANCTSNKIVHKAHSHEGDLAQFQLFLGKNAKDHKA